MKQTQIQLIDVPIDENTIMTEEQLNEYFNSNKVNKKYKLETNSKEFQVTGIYLYIPKNLQHALRRLFFCIYPVRQFAIFIITYNHMFG